MLGKYECKNAHVKQEKMQNKKTSRSNKKTYQEQLEDHEEHYECMNFSKNARWICNWHQTYNLTQDSNKKHKNIFDFYDFMNIFFVFSFNFFENHFEKEK